MRTYGGKMIRAKVRGMIAESRETRDGILWDIDTVNRRCRVKIQGSDYTITAFYPENMEQAPVWLKVGNAVRISHPGGNKGRIEIMGHGLLIPTAIPGGDVTPPEPDAEDAILTGLGISVTDPAGMTVSVAPGTYSLGGVEYTLGALTMDRSDVVMDSPGLSMDGAANVVTLDPAGGTYFRYDIIVAGSDGTSHAVTGANFLTLATAVFPTIPADHIQIGWVLIHPNMTEVTTADINRTFTTPAPATIGVTPSATSMPWDNIPPATPTSITILIEIRDQYGNLVSLGTDAYQVTVTFVTGNGTLSLGASSSTSALVFYMTQDKTITYTRDMVDPGDQSPTFTVDESLSTLSTAFHIAVLNALGNEMF
jgi:hypothetical protein